MPRPQSLQGSMNQHLRPDPVPFIDIAAQRRRLGKSIDEAVARVLGHCQFINGPEVTQLEAELAAFSGAEHVVSCASGTDALLMVLMAKGVGRGVGSAVAKRFSPARPNSPRSCAASGFTARVRINTTMCGSA